MSIPTRSVYIDNLCVSFSIQDFENMADENYWFSDDVINCFSKLISEKKDDSVFYKQSSLFLYNNDDDETVGDDTDPNQMNCENIYCRHVFEMSEGDYNNGHLMHLVIYKEEKKIVLVDASGESFGFESKYKRMICKLLKHIGWVEDEILEIEKMVTVTCNVSNRKTRSNSKSKGNWNIDYVKVVTNFDLDPQCGPVTLAALEYSCCGYIDWTKFRNDVISVRKDVRKDVLVLGKKLLGNFLQN